MLLPSLIACLPSPKPAPPTAPQPAPTSSAPSSPVPSGTTPTFPPSGNTLVWDESCSPEASTGPPAPDTGWPDSGSSDYYGPPARDQLRILSGPALLSGSVVELASTSLAMGWSCGLPDVPALPGDLDHDGVDDIALGCSKYALSGPSFLQLISGASVLAGAPVTLGCVYGEQAPFFSVLGDLDQDQVSELGFAQWSPISSGELVHWTVRASATLPGPSELDATWSILADATRQGDGPPFGVGDFDGDQVSDWVGAQHNSGFTDPSSVGPELVFVSGAALAASPHGTSFSTFTDAFAVVQGPWARGDVVQAGYAGDVDGDGLDDPAVVLAPWFADLVPTGRLPAEVRVLLASSLPTADLDGAVIIRGSHDNLRGQASFVPLGDLDADGLADLGVRLIVDSSSQDEQGEIAVVLGADLAAAGPGGVVPAGPRALGSADPQPEMLLACDLDGDGAVELLTQAELWRGQDLQVPSAPALALPQSLRSVWCGGDMDGVPGEELVQLLPGG
jgi:hypothetical protein